MSQSGLSKVDHILFSRSPLSTDSGFADDLWGAEPPYEEGLTPFYAQFFSQLDFLPLASMYIHPTSFAPFHDSWTGSANAVHGKAIIATSSVLRVGCGA